MENNKISIIESNVSVLGKVFNVYGDFDNPMFKARDIAEWIDYAKNSDGSYQVSKMVQIINDDEKIKTIPTSNNLTGGSNAEIDPFIQPTWFVTEDGLYEILMQSRTEIAKSFKSEIKKLLKGLRTKSLRIIEVKEYSVEDLLRMQLKAIEEKKQLQVELDEALKTKAYISDKKTATAMNTASQLSKENVKLIETNEELKLALDNSLTFATVKKVEHYTGIVIKWKPLRDYSKLHCLEIIKVNDINYGEVNAYHKDAWMHCYKIDITKLKNI